MQGDAKIMSDNSARILEKPMPCTSFEEVNTGSALASSYFELRLKNDRDIVANQLVAAIANGLDIVKLICDGTLTSESTGFWQLSSDWPKVATSLPSGFFNLVIETTAQLVRLGGNDLAAHIPLEALGIYGGKHFAEVEQTLHYALSNTETIVCVMALLKVGFQYDVEKFFPLAIVLLQSTKMDVRAKGAIYSGLRFLQLAELTDAQKNQFVDVLERGLEYESNDILYPIGGTLIHQYVNIRDGSLWQLIEKELKSDRNMARLGLLEHLAALTQGNSLDEVAWEVLKALELPRYDERTVRAIDKIIASVWAKTPELSLRYVENIVQNADDDVGCDSFPETMRKVREMTGAFINKSVTRWFLSNDMRLFRFASELMEGRGKDTDFLIEVDVNSIGDHVANPWFLGRKGIGWFYLYHKTCVSFVMSCMAIMDEAVLKDFMPYFFNPVCLHYTQDVADYLANKKEDADKPYHKMASLALSQAQAVYEKAKKILPMPDFEPSTQQRAAFARHQDKQMVEIFKQAREKSVFWELFASNPVILLHGRKFVQWQKDEKGNYKRSESSLTQSKVDFTMPSLQRLDGLTLKYSLAHMRFERLNYETDC